MKKIYLIATVFAIIAGFATWLFATEIDKKTTIKDVEKATVVVPLADIDEYTVLTPEMLTTVQLPTSSITYGTVTKVEDIVGYMNNVKLYAGEQIIADKLTLVGQISGDSRLSYELKKGEFAVGITCDEAGGISGYLKPGDRVNIFSVNSGAGETKLVLSNVLVLKVGTFAENKAASAEEAELSSYSNLVLSLNDAQIKQFGAERASNPDYFFFALVPFSEGNQMKGEINEDVTKHEIQTNPYSPVTIVDFENLPEPTTDEAA
ncbi:MAG: Flp pilus assembly protein CpaB [Acutalibacteraceae bacterium]